MQDSHRQKHWASEQKEAASKDMGSRQPDRKQEHTDRKAADPFPLDSLLERGRIFKQDAQALTSSVRESADLFNRYVTEQVEQRPYTTMGIAAGLGYVLGGGLANRITGTALGTAYRLGLALAARELSSRISIPGVSEESPRLDRSAR